MKGPLSLEHDKTSGAVDLAELHRDSPECCRILPENESKYEFLENENAKKKSSDSHTERLVHQAMQLSRRSAGLRPAGGARTSADAGPKRERLAGWWLTCLLPDQCMLPAGA